MTAVMSVEDVVMIVTGLSAHRPVADRTALHQIDMSAAEEELVEDGIGTVTLT